MTRRWAVVASVIVSLPATAMANIVGPEESTLERMVADSGGLGPYALVVLGVILVIMITLKRVGDDEHRGVGDDGDEMNDAVGESRSRQ